ncbi:MAG: WG repeat-containing protein, partial [Acidobacteriota bacterium]
GYIDNTGNMVIPPQFEDAEDFSEGLAAVKIGNLYGYIDRTGKLVIPAQFSHTHRFMGGVAQVVINKRTGYIDRTGRVLWLQKDSPKEDHESEHHHKH